MRSSTGYPHRAGQRVLFVLDNCLWALVVMAIGVASMALLACAIDLARGTTGHDWYATGKLTLTELLIGLGANDSAPVEYRTSKGEVLSLTRHALTFNGNALVGRWNVLYTARQAAELGAWWGFGGALLCLVLFRRQNQRWRQLPAREPASVQSTPVQPAPRRPRRPLRNRQRGHPIRGCNGPRGRNRTGSVTQSQPPGKPEHDQGRAASGVSDTTDAGSDGRVHRRRGEPVAGRELLRT